MGRRRGLLMPYVPHSIKESLKSEVEATPVKFPKELGEEHPFDFKQCEMTYVKNGLIKTGVDKHIDFTISPGFYVKSSVKGASDLINKFIQESGFDQTLRDLLIEAFTKGNGFMEISVNKNEVLLKVIDACSMYIERNKNGEITGYNQWIGKKGIDKYDPKKVIPFLPEEIIHFPISKVGDNAYGFGLIYPMLMILNNILNAEKQMHVQMNRKANNPYVLNVGTVEEPATQQEITDLGQKFEYLNNMHEWIFDHRVKMSTVDFGNLGEKFASIIEHDKESLFMALQVPAVIMGSGFQNEGIAKVQIDTFERRIQSIQAQLEKVIEERVFQPILRSNGIDADIEIEWGQPSEEETNQRVLQLTSLLQNAMISPQLRAMIEKDVASKLGYDEKDIDLLPEPKLDMKSEAEKEAELKQPEMPGAKPGAKEIRESLEQDYNLNEWLNFDYQNYKSETIAFIRKDLFNDLRGHTEEDFKLGLLTPTQIEKLKEILIKNFENNGTILQIANDLKEANISPRYIMDGDEKRLLISSEARRLIIARTESTRVAAEGVLNNYESKDVNKVRFLASLSNRTCPICEGLNGQIFNLNEARGVIPVHTSCRCTWIALQE